MATFVRRKNPVTAMYWAYLIFWMTCVLYLFIGNELDQINSRYWIIGLSGGLLVSLLISPVLHELVHSLYFRLNGASKLIFSWNYKHLHLNIRAREFVLSKKKYFGICIFTFALFSVAPFIIALYSSGVVVVFLLAISFFHALYALKDLAVCSYLHKFRQCYIYNSVDNETEFYTAMV